MEQWKQLQTVIDKMAIQDVLTAYCRGVDRMDFDLVRSCYTSDAHDDHGLYVGPIEGYIAWMADKAVTTMVQTMHSVTNVHIELGEDGTAKSESYVFALHRMTSSRAASGVADHWVGARYLDDWRRVEESAWRIHRRRVIWDWSRSDALTCEWQLPATALRFSRSPDDPSYGHCDWRI
jgi:hypothetical protein